MKNMNLIEFKNFYNGFIQDGIPYAAPVLNPFLYTPQLFHDYTSKYIFVYDCLKNLAFPELFFKRLYLSLVRRYLQEKLVGINTIEEFVMKGLNIDTIDYSFEYFLRIKKLLQDLTGSKIKIVFLNFQEILKLEKFNNVDIAGDVKKLNEAGDILLMFNLLSTSQHKSIFEIFDSGNLICLDRFSESSMKKYLENQGVAQVPSDFYEHTFGNPSVIDFVIQFMGSSSDNISNYLDRGLSNYFERIISMISGDVSFKSIFLIFAYKDGIKLNELSFFLNKKPGVIQTYLSRLIHFNIITKTNKVYSINYPELLSWLRTSGEFDEELDFRRESTEKVKISKRKFKIRKPVKKQKSDIPDYF